MTEIKIKRLVLENFKCHRNLTLTFNGGNASIYGDNASGKTSVYDALTWLLFGKETKGLPEELLHEHPDECVRLPMLDDDAARSLNLSNTVAVGVYEVLRQWDYPELQNFGQLHNYEW